MLITKIKIYNFRSLDSIDIDLNEISLFVGFNDVGKSNVLKALNLFFNGKTDYEKKLDFTQDYNKLAPLKKKKAQEIIIELIIKAPNNYKGSKNISWKKCWRKNGLYENLKFTDGTEFPKKSKLNSWIQNIRYTYVPAIRGNIYFEILLADLHDSLAETVAEELRKAGTEFIDKINTNTKTLISEVDARLKIQSQIHLPSNLQSLFKTLNFSTKEGVVDISLSNRGDGIKTRHIPVILKFISDQLNRNKIQGAPNINMIWGYEEPENNLEMTVTFELAKEFIDYSKDIQLLFTTHSAGFYNISVENPKITNLFKVTKYKGSSSNIVLFDSIKNIDEQLGLMPLVAPYIKEQLQEAIKLNEKIISLQNKINDYEKSTIFVEGDDEIRIFKKMINVSKKSTEIQAIKCTGCSGVRENLIAFSYSPKKFKVIGLFDSDKSGKSEKQKLEIDLKYQQVSKNKQAKAIEYSIPEHLKNIKSKLPKFPIEIEEMYMPEVWKFCKTKKFLESRPASEINEWVKINDIKQSTIQIINSLNFTQDELLYIYNKIPDKNKDKVSKYLTNLSDTLFLNNIDSINKFFKEKILNFIEIDS